MNRSNISFTIALIVLAVVMFLAGRIYENVKNANDSSKGHICIWSNCPYKGVKPVDYSKSVLLNTESEEGSEQYCIDMLHLKYPDCNYDSLADMLFNNSH